MGIKVNDSLETEEQYEAHEEKNKDENADKIYLKTFVKKASESPWWISFTFLTTAAFITRLSYLSYLPGTTWDEVHFGGFANQYINKTFYHDVHPPLGKIMVAAAAYVTGYKGNFNFSQGNMYDDTIRYQMIRSEMAVLGALLVPFSFLTVYELSHSVGASSMAALGVLCDTFLHKINTLILLDPPLNLAILISVFCTFKFYSYRDREFEGVWWKWMSLTGAALGVVMSIKYVGVFTVLFVGMHTVFQLYSIACDKSRSIWWSFPHFAARVLCLIVLPFLIYIGGFVIHLTILSETTPETGAWLHTRFVASLNNTEYDNKTFPKYVNYGANITIQSSSLHVGYLDSWYDLYPSELTAACQVVSTITLRDPEGTMWTMKPVDIKKGSVLDTSDPSQPPIAIRNGDWVMLTHLGTLRSLRSHGRRAPFTRRLFQVCGYGDDGVGGPFETWQIIVPGMPEGEPIEVFGHDFMLKNFQMNCYLSASDVNLPSAWAHEGAKEVACSKNPNYPTLLWHINWIETNKTVGETKLKEHTMSLWERVFQLHKIMFNMNAGLKSDDSDAILDITISSPWMWPIAYQMQLLGGYAENPEAEVDRFSVAAFNPLIAYSNIVSFFALLLLVSFHFFRVLRTPGENPSSVDRRKKTLWACLWLNLCWGLHYLPFFFMSRSLYIHHYCPAFIFSCLSTGVVLDYFSEACSEAIRRRVPRLRVRKEYILLLPATAFVVSYACLYPLATYVEGHIFTRTSLNDYLDKLYLGQRWLQFGYQKNVYDELSGSKQTSVMVPIENMENPYLNATLYYETDLNATMSKKIDKEQINPFPASNFTSNFSSTRTNSTKTETENFSINDRKVIKDGGSSDQTT